MQVNKSVGYDLINSYLRLCRYLRRFVVTSCAFTLVETVKLCCFSVNHDTCITTGGKSPPYVLDVTLNRNWANAQRYCREEFTDLATIDNMREMEMLNSTMNEAGAEKPWIGLKQGSSPKWQWSLADRDRENEEKFRKWASDQPQGTNNNCAVMKGDGTWYNRSCGATKPFICYDGEKPSYSLTLEYRQLKLCK